MDTLIKWPGGKKNEIKYIKELIPNFDNYVEPFLGGGALFFDLEPKNAYVNDISTDLIQFYQLLSEKDTRKTLEEILLNYNDYWDYISEINDDLYPEFKILYDGFKFEKIDKNALKELIKEVVDKNESLFLDTFPNNIYLDKEVYIKEINRNLASKIPRTVKLDLKKPFSEEQIKDNIETALRSAFYMHERYKLNKFAINAIEVSKEENTANYYYVREYCYGSMFRYNKNGEYNIPYGGMSYNKKNFKEKLDKLFSQKTYNILHNAHILNCDFEDFLNHFNFTEKDFIFFDPPYDTDFSTYDDNAFTLEDQKRLANCIYNLDAKFIFIIKKTDFIWDLYANKEGIYIEVFDKKYSYNVRGRNDRDVEHLIIHNIKSPQTSIDNFME
ncbi:MAG: DNA adenine methylase [Methanobrevibacter sp.]|jgi:DNA adenine methylase|nr:DNA adenine methylase [Methanobrevibacter sp.]